MARLVFEMNQSLDGYVDHPEMRPSPVLFRHFIEQVRHLTGSVYGRRMYEVMRYWDDDHPEWGAEECDFATAWRSQPIRISMYCPLESSHRISVSTSVFVCAVRKVRYSLSN